MGSLTHCLLSTAKGAFLVAHNTRGKSMSLTFTAYITIGDESYSLGQLGTNGPIKQLLLPFANEESKYPTGSDEHGPFFPDCGEIDLSEGVMRILEYMAEEEDSAIWFKNIVLNLRKAFDSSNVEASISYG